MRMDVWAVVPVKSLQESKGRLAHLMADDERAVLVRRLLHHVLATVQAVPRITRTLVISSDPEVRQMAEAYGAQAVKEQPPYGLNSAVSHAYDLARQSGADAVLILPADLPFVTTADLELMIDAGAASANGEGGRPLMAICPDRHGSGTNGLLLRPCAPFEFHYGPNSMQRHVHEALERGFLVRLVNAPGLQFDLDVEEDWQAFQARDMREQVNQSEFIDSAMNQ